MVTRPGSAVRSSARIAFSVTRISSARGMRLTIGGASFRPFMLVIIAAETCPCASSRSKRGNQVEHGAPRPYLDVEPTGCGPVT